MSGTLPTPVKYTWKRPPVLSSAHRREVRQKEEKRVDCTFCDRQGGGQGARNVKVESVVGWMAGGERRWWMHSRTRPSGCWWRRARVADVNLTWTSRSWQADALNSSTLPARLWRFGEWKKLRNPRRQRLLHCAGSDSPACCQAPEYIVVITWIHRCYLLSCTWIHHCYHMNTSLLSTVVLLNTSYFKLAMVSGCSNYAIVFDTLHNMQITMLTNYVITWDK